MAPEYPISVKALAYAELTQPAVASMTPKAPKSRRFA